LSKTPWKKLINPDYLGAYSLDDGNGKYTDIVATVQRVTVEEVTGPDGKKENCPVAHFTDRTVKPMILNVTNMKALEKLTGSKYIEDWAGAKIQIGVDRVKAFGDVVDALRIRPRKPRETVEVIKCSDCPKNITPANGMTVDQLATYTNQRYGRPLCAECAIKAKAAQTAAEQPEEVKPLDSD
jgi:hypothetical protein